MVCYHERTEPVTLMNGEVCARLCADCLERVPISHGCPDCDFAACYSLDSPQPTYVLTQPCSTHARDWSLQ